MSRQKKVTSELERLKDFITTAEKMFAEQFFMLASYSRQEYIFNEKSLKERLDLVRILLKREQLKAEPFQKLIEMLENGVGSVDIIRSLDTEHFEQESLLREISEAKIAFPELEKSELFEYNLFHMYHSIFKPIEVVSMLMLIGILKREYETFTLNKLDEYLISNGYKSPFRESKYIITKYFPDEYTLVEAIEHLDSTKFDFDKFIQEFKNKLASKISEIACNVHEILKSPFNADGEILPQYVKIKASNKEKIDLSINTRVFKGLIEAGQRESVSHHLINILVEKLEMSSFAFKKSNPEGSFLALEQVCEWQTKHSANFLTRIDQIPSYTAGIIYFDLYFNVGEIGGIRNSLKQKNLTHKDCYRLTSCFIQNCFINELVNEHSKEYQCNLPYQLIDEEKRTSLFELKLEEIESDVYSRKERNRNASIMAHWATPLVNPKEEKENLKVLNKYKKLSKYLRVRGKDRTLELVEPFISKQRKNSKKSGCVYPLSGHFPMPFWF